MYSYLALILVGGAFGLYFGAEELKVKPLQLFTRYFLIYIVVDLFMKYFAQKRNFILKKFKRRAVWR